MILIRAPPTIATDEARPYGKGAVAAQGVRTARGSVVQKARSHASIEIKAAPTAATQAEKKHQPQQQQHQHSDGDEQMYHTTLEPGPT